MDRFTEISADELPWKLLLLADPSRTQIEKYIFRSRTFVLSRDATAIGVVVLLACGEVVEIMNLAVTPELQGQGIGKLLLNQAQAAARTVGAKSLCIGTGNSSLNQLALYQKVGFRIESVDRDFFTKNYDEPIIENGIVCRDMIRLSLKL